MSEEGAQDEFAEKSLKESNIPKNILIRPNDKKVEADWKQREAEASGKIGSPNANQWSTSSYVNKGGFNWHSEWATTENTKIVIRSAETYSDEIKNFELKTGLTDSKGKSDMLDHIVRSYS